MTPLRRTTTHTTPIQSALPCVHRFRLQEVSERHYVNGTAYVWGVCSCGAKREQRVVVEADVIYHTPVGHGRRW